MAKLVRSSGSVLLAALVLGLLNLGGKCDNGTPANSPKGGGAAEATCADLCACMASACPDYPFAPDCVAACQDPTTSPPWDLGCRANECTAAKADHDTHCPNASGQTKCH